MANVQRCSACFSDELIVSLDSWKQDIKNASKSLRKGHVLQAIRGLKIGNAVKRSICDAFDDIHSDLMFKYPDWWFWTVLLISFLIDILLVYVYTEVNTPVLTPFFAFRVDFVLLIHI